MTGSSHSVRSLVLGFFRTLAMLFTGTLCFAALGFLTQVLVTWQLPMSQVGPLAALLAVINFLTPVATAGVNYFMLQSFGREGSGASRWLPACLRLCATATGLCILMLAGYVLRGAADIGSWATLLLMTTAILLGQLSVELGTGLLQYEGRYGALSIWQGLSQLGRFAVVAGLFVAGPSFIRLLGGYALVGVISTGAALLLLLRFWRRANDAAHRPDCPSVVETAQRSIPFALMTMFYVFYFQGPIVTLEWLQGPASAAAYNAAFLVISAISLVPNIIYMKFLLPKICSWAEHDRLVFRSAFHVGVPAMLACGTALMAIVMLTAPGLIPMLFGASYAAGMPALMILALTIPVRFVQTVYSSLFVRSSEILRKISYLGIAAATGAASSLILIPRWSLLGAATATLLAEVVLLLLHIYGTARHIEGIDVASTLRFRTFQTCLRHLLHPRTAEE